MKGVAAAIIGLYIGYSGSSLAGSIDYGVDRAGSDLLYFNPSMADPKLCVGACDAIQECKAWTFVRPGHHEAKARCYLKKAVPDPVDNPCCVSGTR